MKKLMIVSLNAVMINLSPFTEPSFLFVTMGILEAIEFLSRPCHWKTHFGVSLDDDDLTSFTGKYQFNHPCSIFFSIFYILYLFYRHCS